MLEPHPLSSTFGGARAKVLDVLLPIDGELTVRHIARLAEVAPSTASAALRQLEQTGLVISREFGTALGYRINPEHFAIASLRAILSEARDIEHMLVEHIERVLGESPRSIVLFGSRASGRSSPESDIDLLLVAPDAAAADRWRPRLLDVEEDLQRLLGRRIDIVVSTPPSATDTRRPFWREVRRHGRLIAGMPLSRTMSA